MMNIILDVFITLNQLISAGIAITAFSLLLYAFTFNLRDRVARSFAIILLCVVVVFVGDTFASVAVRAWDIEFWLRFQWIGIVFLPAAYLQFSDALLVTTGRPSRGRRRLLVRLTYLISAAFFLALPTSLLVGPLVTEAETIPHLQRTSLTWIFTIFYAVGIVWAWANIYRALQRTVTSASRRRMRYLLAGAAAPALGSFPFLLFGPGMAARHQLLFWLTATLGNMTVYALLVVMAYAVAFFGVSWPDRVVKRRLFKWLMRGPVTASFVLTLSVIVRRTGAFFNIPFDALVPIVMVASILIFEHLITLAAPVWERWLFHGGDRANMHLLQTLEERLLTTSDLRQFLEAVLTAACDRTQSGSAFVASINSQGLDMVVTVGNNRIFEEDPPANLLELVAQNGFDSGLFSWQDHWLVPLFGQRQDESQLLGVMGIQSDLSQQLDEEQREALEVLSSRAAAALEDRIQQQQVFISLEDLSPQMDLIQRLRAATGYAGTNILSLSDLPLEDRNFAKWVKDALSHYWGGPKLTNSPLLRLQVVRQAIAEHEDNPANALRAILNKAIDQTRPDGERRFTGEWILYNILELKFLEGHKVREIARRLALSEADLYRKQRVAVEAVANAITEMEQKAREEEETPS